MKSADAREGRVETDAAPLVLGAVVATLHAVARDGTVTVQLPGRPPAPARALASVSRESLLRALPGRGVLVLCEAGDPSMPVIVGLIEDPAEALLALGEGEAIVAAEVPHRVFSAAESITLVCGEASLTLHADGRVVTRGVNVVSVATEQQRIQGAVVRIN